MLKTLLNIKSNIVILNEYSGNNSTDDTGTETQGRVDGETVENLVWDLGSNGSVQK
jgi:hypothetical protein